MSLTVLQGAVEQGLIYSLVALALYISYRTLDIADLTTDGTFALGAACSAIFTSFGHPVLGLVIAVTAGAAAGFITAFLQTSLSVLPILAGIITMTGLYSVNLMVMGNKANLPILKADNVFTYAEKIFGATFGKLIFSFIIVAVISCLLVWFLRTRTGLSLRATGDNRSMVSASSINPALMTTLGLCLANALTALSGGLIAQYQKFSDATLGTGMVVIGLASLIIGEVFIGRKSVVRGVLAAVAGGILYRIIIAAALSAKVNANNLKLISAVIVAAAISYPAIRSKIAFYRMTKRGAHK